MTMAKIKSKKKIIIIPGIFDVQYECKPLYRIADEMGFEVVIFHYTPWGYESYFSVEKKLENLIKKCKPVGIVGFSHGGTIAVGAKHSLPILSIGGTLRGTFSGYIWHTIGFRQIRFCSDYLEHISEMLEKRTKTIVSVYTPFDIVIIPFTSAKTGLSYMTLTPLHQLLSFWPKTQRVYRKWLSDVSNGRFSE